MTFWSGNKIRDQFRQRNIVQPYHPSKIQYSSYAMSLGEEAFVTPNQKTPAIDRVKRYLAKGKVKKLRLNIGRIEQRSGNQTHTGGGQIRIPPGQFAFLLTEEALAIPNDVQGFISMRASIKWRGLINVSGFHVDPGYKGKLIFSVFNAGPTHITLGRGQELFLLWLADLDSSATGEYARAKKPQLEIPNAIIDNVNQNILSIGDLSDRIQALETQRTIFATVLAVIAAAVGLFLNYYSK